MATTSFSRLAGADKSLATRLEATFEMSSMGLESQGMILAVSGEAGPIILTPDSEVAPGAELH